MRRAGMSAATSTLRRRTMPMSMTRARAAEKNPGSIGVSPVSSSAWSSSARGFFSSIHPRYCQMARKSSMSLISGVPVSAMSSGRGRARADPLGQLQHVLGPLRRLVLDEVRLVEDHAPEAEVAEPADVPVEHLVVDDDDVGEAVDRVAVALDHGGLVLRGPHLRLARPVGLHDVRHHHEQGVGVGGLRREEGLGGLAQSGLVGQQEGAVTVRSGGDELGLVRASAPGPSGTVTGLGSGRSMQADEPLAARSNDESSGPISSQLARRRGGGVRRSVVSNCGARKGSASRREMTDCGTT